MRMKFLRIRPETWVSTSWLFSSFTLNMALGNVSTTVAITSIASSFDKLYPLLPAALRTACFGLSTATRSKSSLRWPSPPPCAQNEHSCFRRLVTAVQPSSSTLTSGLPAFTMGSIAITMPGAASCPDPLRRNSAPAAPRASGTPIPWPTKSRTTEKPSRFHHSLHRGPDIAQRRSRLHRRNPRMQRRFRHPQQPRRLRSNLFAHRHRDRRIAISSRPPPRRNPPKRCPLLSGPASAMECRAPPRCSPKCTARRENRDTP